MKNMDYELVDLIDIVKLKKLTDNWTKLINLPMGRFDTKGNVLLGSGWLPVCTDFHRVNPITAERCYQSDLQTSNQLKAGKDFCYLTCPNGLVDAGTAVKIEGKYDVGGLGLPKDPFQRINAADRGAMSKQLLDLVEQIPPKFRHVADAMADLVSQYQFSKIVALTEMEKRDG